MARSFDLVIFYNINDYRLFLRWKRDVQESLLWKEEEREKILKLLRGGPVLAFLQSEPEAHRALITIPPYIESNVKRKYQYTLPVMGTQFTGKTKENAKKILDILGV